MKGGKRNEMYLRRDGREVEVVNPTENTLVARENAMNFPLTATITVSKKEWEDLILANDRMNRELTRIKSYLIDEAQREEVFADIRTMLRLLDIDPDVAYKKMP